MSLNPLRAAIAPYADVIRIGLSLLASLLLVALIYLAAVKPRMDLAEERQAHDRLKLTLAEGTARQEAAEAQERSAYDAGVKSAAAMREKETTDAYERGKAVGERIRTGAQRVRIEWRDCPVALSGEGAGPVEGAADVSGRRADAIGRILGYGGGWDAQYAETYGRLVAAQGLLDKCYDQPAR